MASREEDAVSSFRQRHAQLRLEALQLLEATPIPSTEAPLESLPPGEKNRIKVNAPHKEIGKGLETSFPSLYSSASPPGCTQLPVSSGTSGGSVAHVGPKATVPVSTQSTPNFGVKCPPLCSRQGHQEETEVSRASTPTLTPPLSEAGTAEFPMLFPATSSAMDVAVPGKEAAECLMQFPATTSAMVLRVTEKEAAEAVRHAQETTAKALEARQKATQAQMRAEAAKQKLQENETKKAAGSTTDFPTSLKAVSSTADAPMQHTGRLPLMPWWPSRATRVKEDPPQIQPAVDVHAERTRLPFRISPASRNDAPGQDRADHEDTTACLGSPIACLRIDSNNSQQEYIDNCVDEEVPYEAEDVCEAYLDDEDDGDDREVPCQADLADGNDDDDIALPLEEEMDGRFQFALKEANESCQVEGNLDGEDGGDPEVPNQEEMVEVVQVDTKVGANKEDAGAGSEDRGMRVGYLIQNAASNLLDEASDNPCQENDGKLALTDDAAAVLCKDQKDDAKLAFGRREDDVKLKLSSDAEAVFCRDHGKADQTNDAKLAFSDGTESVFWSDQSKAEEVLNGESADFILKCVEARCELLEQRTAVLQTQRNDLRKSNEEQQHKIDTEKWLQCAEIRLLQAELAEAELAENPRMLHETQARTYSHPKPQVANANEDRDGSASLYKLHQHLINEVCTRQRLAEEARLRLAKVVHQQPRSFAGHPGSGLLASRQCETPREHSASSPAISDRISDSSAPCVVVPYVLSPVLKPLTPRSAQGSQIELVGDPGMCPGTPSAPSSEFCSGPPQRSSVRRLPCWHTDEKSQVCNSDIQRTVDQDRKGSDDISDLMDISDCSIASLIQRPMDGECCVKTFSDADDTSEMWLLDRDGDRHCFDTEGYLNSFEMGSHGTSPERENLRCSTERESDCRTAPLVDTTSASTSNLAEATSASTPILVEATPASDQAVKEFVMQSLQYHSVEMERQNSAELEKAGVQESTADSSVASYLLGQGSFLGEYADEIQKDPVGL
eukprot:gnl/MRDRNA2_/MRDRNA2_114151_c0_seq1.p1 gnl/MRDRNA2_/MRDRNA2_114151_c0~~gnl/MRDRNA2_/MRDRNA2_114151_c0_seq1.p1  ORF type:complete len:1013 (+),score=224.32 gnl/MRDRNA2_/MRDRNA2_114151_c0_seq1:57-3095(+)